MINRKFDSKYDLERYIEAFDRRIMSEASVTVEALEERNQLQTLLKTFEQRSGSRSAGIRQEDERLALRAKRQGETDERLRKMREKREKRKAMTINELTLTGKGVIMFDGVVYRDVSAVEFAKQLRINPKTFMSRLYASGTRSVNTEDFSPSVQAVIKCSQLYKSKKFVRFETDKTIYIDGKPYYGTIVALAEAYGLQVSTLRGRILRRHRCITTSDLERSLQKHLPRGKSFEQKKI